MQTDIGHIIRQGDGCTLERVQLTLDVEHLYQRARLFQGVSSG